MRVYTPREDEREKASNGYLMSVMVIMAGLPLPIINLLATGLFYLFNRRASYYVRWHCMQALLSQLTILVINSIALTWTIRVFTGYSPFTNQYFAYMIMVIALNIFEIILNISAAVRVRKGKHVEYWFWGTLTQMLVAKR
ncbi:MAG: DUF4870 domain-containing protein [Bacteroidetes bacterium]|nr:DUF4870 domain-containing protein [Bacteroidota bacterium]